MPIINYTSKQYSGIWNISKVTNNLANNTWPTQQASLYDWGNNNYGQLGLNSTVSYSSPKQVGALTNWLSISSGPYNRLAIKTDGEIKKKGDFLTDFELHKNKSARIIPLALERHFAHNDDVRAFIRSHKNIYDFCLRQKASSDFHYEGINKATGEKTIYNKLIRYYVSKTGEKLLKVKNEDSDSTANDITQIEAGEWVCTVCNMLPKNASLDNINYDYYIERCERIIRKIQTEGRAKNVIINPQQLSLF